MTVGDDDDDAGEGSGRDTHSEVGRDSISGSASPVVVIVSAGNNSSSSITDSRHHQIQWHRHHHRNHEQHFHAYPVKDHPTRGPDDDQEDAAGAATGVDSHDECNVRKIRRNRTVFTELQLMGLERRFDSQKYLSTPDRADLARVLGLTQLQVKTWYQVFGQTLSPSSCFLLDSSFARLQKRLITCIIFVSLYSIVTVCVQVVY